MFNSVTLVGRTTDKPTVRTLENGQVVGNVVLAVNRPYRNSDGNVDTDFIPCTLWNSVATNCNQYCGKGSLVLVKGIIVQKDEMIKVLNQGEEVERKKKRPRNLGRECCFSLRTKEMLSGVDFESFFVF